MLDPLDVVIIIEDENSVACDAAARALAARTGFKLITRRLTNKKAAPSKWQLVYTQQGLALRVSSEPSWGDIRVDFASDALQYRKHHGGGRNEALAKAIGIKGKTSLKVIDCTAGMGKDSFVMACVGATVTMLERSTVIAALLEDALTRAQDLPEVQAMQLHNTDASEFMLAQMHSEPQLEQPDVVYMDPMFPHKAKSALVKKEMRAFQQLLGADTDSTELLSAALNFALHRVVVKRPSYAEPIALPCGRLPSMAIASKKHRFDVYIQH